MPGKVRVRDDGTSFATVTPISRLHIDGFDLGDGGWQALLGFDRDGSVRWARDRRDEILWTYGDVVLTTQSYPLALERRGAADGTLISEEPAPDGVRWLAIAQAACEATCTTREVRALFWHDRIDLGSLGVLEAPFGFTVVAFEDGLPRWHWSTPLESSFTPLVILPTTGIAPDGSVTFIVWSGTFISPAPLCLAGTPCFNFPNTLIVRLSPTGIVDFANVVEAARSVIMADDGDSILSANDEIARFDPRGARVWSSDRIGGFGGLLATDVRTGDLWATLGIPASPIDLAGTIVAGCVLSVGISVLVKLDPFTGEIVRTNGVFQGWATAMEPHPTGGVVIEIYTNERPPSLSLCGRNIERDDEPGGPIDVTFAHVE